MARRGIAFITVLIFLLVLMIGVVAFISLNINEIHLIRRQGNSTRAFYLAEAGIQKATSELTADGSYTGTASPVSLGSGVYETTVTSLSNGFQIISTGYVPDKVSTDRVERTVECVLERPAVSITVPGALTVGGDATLTGHAEVEGEGIAGITVPDEDSISVGGSAEVEGDPPVSYAELASFEDIFGMSESVMRQVTQSAGTYYEEPGNNEPDPANGITWVEGDGSYTKSGWSGSGVLIITGDANMTGGSFTGLIYVMGDANFAGNIEVQGAVLVEGDIQISGHAQIEYDSEDGIDIGDAYPYRVTSWLEL